MTRGKKAKAMRVDRTAEREARRRKERQQTIFTTIVIAIVVAIGGVLIYFSAQEPTDLAESPSELPTDFPTDLASEPSEPPDTREVACGGKAPSTAGEEKKTYTEPEQVLKDGEDYQATITTSCGPIVVDLYEEESPETVNSFVFLAQQGFFDGLEIFRNATSIGALQTGAGGNDATWDIGYQIKDELEKAEADQYPPGTLAMANSGPNSAGSQFFFVYNEKFTLPPTYAVFGKTDAAGLSVLEKIGKIPTQAPDDPTNETPSELVYMESVEITTK